MSERKDELPFSSSSRGPGKGMSGDDASYPVAPYPPVHARAAGSPQKSALSSSPLYSTVYGGGAASALATISARGDTARGDYNMGANSSDVSLTSSTAATDSDFNTQLSSSMRIGSNGRQYHKTGSNVSSGNTSSASTLNNIMSSASSINAPNNNNANTHQAAPSSVRSHLTFCPGWHYLTASINCVSSPTTLVRPLPHIMSSDGASKSSLVPGPADAKQTSSSRKLGPIMLELRRVEVVDSLLKRQPTVQREKMFLKNNERPSSKGGLWNIPSASFRDVSDSDNDKMETLLDDTDEGENLQEQFFSTRVVGVSRGNPSFGLSVASTCLTMSTVESHEFVMAATGSSTGALCIHRFDVDGLDEMGTHNASENGGRAKLSFSAAPVEYFHNSRHHRQATAVAWRPVQTRHVAVGLVGSAMTGSISHTGHHNSHRRAAPGMRTSSDREFCCFLWDINDNKKTSPLQKLCHNSPVASLAWMMDGQTLVVGGIQRTVHLYDMRIAAGTNVPPLSAHVHESGVHGIEVDPHRPFLMATFCRGVGEPVKLFDIRRMEKSVSEIKIVNSMYHDPSSLSNAAQRTTQAKVEGVKWSVAEPGMLAIATGDSVQHYDTSTGTRPSLMKVSQCKAGRYVKDIAMYTGEKEKNIGSPSKSQDRPPHGKLGVESEANVGSDRLLSMLYPRRMLTVLDDRTVQDISLDCEAPLALSRRDGRLVHALGPHLWVGSSKDGPTAMERTKTSTKDDDVSAVMMKRARCLQTSAYSMNPESNIKLLSREKYIQTKDTLTKTPQVKNDNLELIRLWSWIDRVEALSFQDVEDLDDENVWTATGLLDAGGWQILGLDLQTTNTDVSFSETFGCNVYDSLARRAALTAYGWAGKYDLAIVMAECEALGEFERSAALAVWHENVGAAVVALQRGSQAVRLQANELLSTSSDMMRYAETLDLIAMCIAGYGGKTAAQLAVWRTACVSLLQREDLSMDRAKQSGIAYLRGLCEFLLNVGTNESLVDVLDNPYLSLNDRAAFASRFLGDAKLSAFLRRCVEKCQRQGSIEGLVITGLGKEGVKILQSFVDIYSDIQTAALVVSRVVLPPDWTSERKICLEWVECYRGLLNNWQMWQSRAMFDVDRAEVLRRVKTRAVGVNSNQRRLQQNPRARQSPQPPDLDILSLVPAQMEVRCNYCSSPISLKRNAGMTNQWLSKMQALLNCCPQCRKPLPRCSICLLSLGALNPYVELTRQRQGSRGISGKSTQAPDDLSSLSSMSFAEWYTWCMRCRHGGHAHHMLGWFSNQKTCPVSGCNCECEFDGVQKLNRPAFCIETENDESS